MLGPMPENVASFGGDFDALTTQITWITGVVFVLAELLLLYVVIRYRRGASPRAAYVTGSGWKQTRYVLAPVFVVVALDAYIDVRTGAV